jgi:hypothetical protein
MHPTPLTLGLWALGVVIVALLVFTASRPRLRTVWREQFAETRRERLFLASVGFFLTFTIVRALTHAIRAGRGPFHNFETSGGLHIHHMVWGILLLLLIGYCWLVRIGTGERGGGSAWLGRFLSLLYGAAAALTLDEFALWLNLRDVYWEREGRESIGAVFLFGSLLSIGVWGAPFIHGLGRELVRLARAGTGRGISRA